MFHNVEMYTIIIMYIVCFIYEIEHFIFMSVSWSIFTEGNVLCFHEYGWCNCCTVVFRFTPAVHTENPSSFDEHLIR